MSEWLIFDEETGAELRRETGDGWQLAEGEAASLVPASAQGSRPITAWSPAMRGWADVPRKSADEIFDLFTADEKAAILTSGIAQVIGLVLALRFMREPIAANDSFHIQGVALLAGLGFLTAERAAQVLAFIPPPEEPEE